MALLQYEPKPQNSIPEAFPQVKPSKRGRPPKLKKLAQAPIRKEGLLCKAGNLNCSLMIGGSLAMGSVGVSPCDICCSEFAFCRDCKCILCGMTIDYDCTSYMSIRCHARLSGTGFCGHAAHLICALECQMAGVVERLDLDMEYICRRCDRKTDLREHVIQLVESLKYTNSRATIEKNLNIALQIMQGTQHGGARSLESLVKNAVQMVRKGSNTQDVYDMLNARGAESLKAKDHGTGDPFIQKDGMECNPAAVEKMKENPQTMTTSAEDEMQLINPETQSSLQLPELNDRATENGPCTIGFNTEHEGIDLAPSATGLLNLVSSTSNLPPMLLSSDMAPNASCQMLEDANDGFLSSLAEEGLRTDAAEIHVPQKTLIGALEDVNDLSPFSGESSLQVLIAGFEKDIQQALEKLQEAQAAEYNLTHERLNHQKESVRKRYEELEAARCGLDQHLSNSTFEVTSALMDRISGSFQELQNELANFHTMLGKEKGFDQT